MSHFLSKLWRSNDYISQDLKYAQCSLDELTGLEQHGFQLIGLTRQGDEYFVAVVRNISSERKIKEQELLQFYLYRLPVISESNCKALMTVFICSKCKTWISDWRTMERHHGYGRMLMKAVLIHLRNAGFQSIHGAISPVDSNGSNRLYQIFEELGFRISYGKGWPRIHLDLRAPSNNSDSDSNKCIRAPQFPL